MISPAGDLREFMAQVSDSRGRQGTRHPLSRPGGNHGETNHDHRHQPSFHQSLLLK